MDCSGLHNLMFLDVACNRLSSLQGLKDIQQLLEINLSENRLTRIGELVVWICQIERNYVLYIHKYSNWK